MAKPTSHDPVWAVMIAEGMPLTREKYLELAYMGQPVEFNAEIEGEIEWALDSMLAQLLDEDE